MSPAGSSVAEWDDPCYALAKQNLSGRSARLQQPCAVTQLARRHDHVRLNLARHRTFTVAAGDCLGRAVRR